MPGHYGLFDSLKEGVLGVFGGPQDPRVAQGTGQREALISAGLATLQGDPQDPLAAIAGGAQIGRQVGQQVQARQLALQQQAALGQFINEAGFDREGLTSVFMRTLASGDLEGAKAVSEILKSLPSEQESQVNRQSVQTVATLAAGAPADVIQRLGVGTNVQVQQDPRTGQIFWENAVPTQPPTDLYEETFVEPNEASPTGAYRIGILRGTGQRDIIGLASPPGGTGGAQSQINRNLASAMQEAERTLSTVDEELANPMVNILGSIARGGGITGNLANIALGAISPEGQMAMAASDQWTAATVRLLSGAQMTDIERQGYRAAYLPLGGEGEEVQRQKAAARGALAALFAEGGQAPTVYDLDTVLIEAGLPIPGAAGGAATPGSSGMDATRAKLRRPGG